MVFCYRSPGGIVWTAMVPLDGLSPELAWNRRTKINEQWQFNEWAVELFKEWA
jgi:hypothetical protein